MTSINNLHTRAMLVNLSISTWSARKFDRKVTQEVADAHGAAADAGRYNKNLMPGDSNSYKALVQFCTAARDRHYEQTLAWSDKGFRLLPVKNYQKYTDQVRKDTHEFNALLDTFVNDYPTLRANALKVLNGLGDIEDFPGDIRSRFGITLDFAPVPQGGDFRVELSQEEIAVIAGKTETRIQQAFADAQKDAIKRLYEVVRKMYAKLAEPDGIFRDSLIENVRDVTGALANLNLADDPILEKLRKEAEKLASATEPDTLRKLPDVRIDTANRAQSILDAITATYGKGIQ